MTKIILLFVAGGLGTLARYSLGGITQKILGTSFPYGTLAVNLLGCFLFGVIWSLAEERFLISSQTRIIFLVGFMGAFTTFSTFAFESVQMMRDSEWKMMLMNVVLHNIAGFAALFIGMKFIREI